MELEIIAELAQGFEGNFEQAKLLIKAAAKSGADAAKFQLVYAEELATSDYVYYPLFKKLEMEDEAWKLLYEYANENKVDLYLDIFGIRSLALCERIGIKGVKLHGTDISNIGLLEEVAKSNIKNVYLGAGGAHLDEIELAVNILKEKEVTILLGFQAYPTPTEDNHIDRVRFLKDYYRTKNESIKIGFADHADPTSPLRYALATAALGNGAKVIEKHITFGKVMEMEDHESALNPDEFLEFSSVMRDCFNALGNIEDSNDFGMTDSEKGYRKMIRRHVVSSKNIAKGTILKATDVVLKRTSSDDFITDLTSVYNKKVLVDIKENCAITKNSIE